MLLNGLQSACYVCTGNGPTRDCPMKYRATIEGRNAISLDANQIRLIMAADENFKYPSYCYSAGHYAVPVVQIQLLRQTSLHPVSDFIVDMIKWRCLIVR